MLFKRRSARLTSYRRKKQFRARHEIAEIALKADNDINFERMMKAQKYIPYWFIESKTRLET